MNNKKNHLFKGLNMKSALFLICACAAISCSDDDEPKKNNNPGISEVTLDGGPFTNLTAKGTTASPAMAVYSPDEDLTAITYSAMADGEEYYVVIAFPGKAKGQHAWNEENCFVQVMTEVDNADEGITATFINLNNSVHTGHVRIDSYGEVGGVISGSFEGGCTYIDASDLDESCVNCLETGTMKGRFEAKRVQ